MKNIIFFAVTLFLLMSVNASARIWQLVDQHTYGGKWYCTYQSDNNNWFSESPAEVEARQRAKFEQDAFADAQLSPMQQSNLGNQQAFGELARSTMLGGINPEVEAANKPVQATIASSASCIPIITE